MKRTATGLNRTLAASLGLALIGLTIHAQDQPPMEPGRLSNEDLLPQPVYEGHFKQILSHSPVLRTLDLSETYALRGVAEIDGQPVATLYTRETKKTIYVTGEETNDQGMKLVEVVPARDLLGVSAKISVGGEEVELKFESSRIAPQPKSGGKPGGSGGKDEKRKGPSKEDLDRYKALSDEKKEKLRNFIRATMQKYPNMSREDRGNLIRGAMQKLSDGRDIEVPKVDGNSGGGGGPRPPGGDRR